MAAQPSPTFYQSLAAGGLAGTAVDLLFFPIDTIKTRLQSSQGFLRAGGFTGIYKGIGSVVVGSAPGAAVFFCTYDTMKRTLPFSSDYAPVTHMVSASLGEIVRMFFDPRHVGLMDIGLTKAACSIRVPTEVIKTRTQTSTYGNAASSSLAAAKRVLVDEGVRGFYRGFRSTIMREIPFTSLQFPLYELLKKRLSRTLDRDPLYAHEAAMCGSFAGGVAAAITTPLDVLKTRVMLDLRDPSQQKLPSLATRFKQIYVFEGTRALFAGVVPRTLWISAGGAVFLGVYEWAVHGLMSY